MSAYESAWRKAAREVVEAHDTGQGRERAITNLAKLVEGTTDPVTLGPDHTEGIDPLRCTCHVANATVPRVVAATGINTERLEVVAGDLRVTVEPWMVERLFHKLLTDRIGPTRRRPTNI